MSIFPRQFDKLFPCVLLCLFVGWMGGIITEDSVKTWYPTLHKPSWTPPNWVFPLVWTLLYTLMGISLWLVWITPASEKWPAYLFFAVQMALNFAWSWIFFYEKSLFFALAELTVLWLCAAGMIYHFRKINPLAGYLQLPYLLWLTYAFSLNAYIWLYN